MRKRKKRKKAGYQGGRERRNRVAAKCQQLTVNGMSSNTVKDSKVRKRSVSAYIFSAIAQEITE